MALAECQGARRAIKSARPHCFEIMLKGELLQMAAPDEYVASEWLQALLQSASGVSSEMHKQALSKFNVSTFPLTAVRAAGAAQGSGLHSDSHPEPFDNAA